jgi:hypothetical protein
LKMSKQSPIAGVPTPSVGVALWQIACQWVSPLRLSRGACEASAASYPTPSWAPPKEAPPVLVAAENSTEEYGPWQWAAVFGRATGLICAEAFVLQENGTLRCPAGSSLWLSRSASRECLYPGAPSRLALQEIVRNADSVSNVWGAQPEETVLVG